jgi:hypothetical protein
VSIVSMNILRSLVIFVLGLLVILLALIVIGAAKRVYTGISALTSADKVDKCVDLLVVDATFTIDPLSDFIQDIKIENGMSLIVHTNGVDDGVYIVLHRQLVRLQALMGGDSFHVTSGLYRHTVYTVPKADEEYGKKFLTERGDALRHEGESFIVITDDDNGDPFIVLSTSLTHVISLVNQSNHDIELRVYGHVLDAPTCSRSRYLVSHDTVVELF